MNGCWLWMTSWLSTASRKQTAPAWTTRPGSLRTCVDRASARLSPGLAVSHVRGAVRATPDSSRAPGGAPGPAGADPGHLEVHHGQTPRLRDAGTRAASRAAAGEGE